jgi:transcriptional regulator with XRE-family HTH domain
MIGKNLRGLRKNQGKSQIDVARETGISQKNLSKYETNKFNPKYETIKKLADYYNVTVAYLLGEEEKVESVDKDIDTNINNNIEQFIDRLITDNIITDINNINNDVAKIILNTVINEYKLKKLKKLKKLRNQR